MDKEQKKRVKALEKELRSVEKQEQKLQKALNPVPPLPWQPVPNTWNW